MSGHTNPRAARIPSQQPFFNWCIRLLLERVTDWCERRALKYYNEPRHVKLIFSKRGGLAYSQTKAYLEYLKPEAVAGSTYLRNREIRPSVVDWRLVEAIPHRSSAGVQIADSVASAFYQAADAVGSLRLRGRRAGRSDRQPLRRGAIPLSGRHLRDRPDGRGAHELRDRQRDPDGRIHQPR
jgi:hypothetical protein